MMKRPSESLNPWGTFPQRNKPNRFGKPGWIPIFYFLIPLLVLSTWSGCGNPDAYQILDTPHQVIDQWGKSRVYTLYRPPGQKKFPLLVYFHGVMSDGFKSIPALKNYTGSPVEETGLIEFCKRQGIILLVPRSAYRYTFLNQEATGWLPFNKEIDGIEKMIDLVVEKYPVSSNAIYLVGISAGAGMCHHLANRRPDFYNTILSHSQGYVGQDNILLKPTVEGPRFGVVFCFTRGDYDNLIDICIQSEKIYRKSGYRTVLLKNLPPKSHSWSRESNRRFWRYMQNVGRKQN